MCPDCEVEFEWQYNGASEPRYAEFHGVCGCDAGDEGGAWVALPLSWQVGRP